MIKKYLQNNLLSFLFVVIFVSFSVLTIGLAWTEPTAFPPGGNVSAPLNVGIIPQTKAGPLMINFGSPRASTGLVVLGDSYFDGNVGIGTLRPRAQFDVKNGGVLNQVAIGSAPFGKLPYPYESIQLPTGTNLRINFGFSERMIITSSGNVGIGTPTPAGKLHVSGLTILQNDSSFLYGMSSGGQVRFAINNDPGPMLNFYGRDSVGFFPFMTVNNAGKRDVSFNAGNVNIGNNLLVAGSLTLGGVAKSAWPKLRFYQGSDSECDKWVSCPAGSMVVGCGTGDRDFDKLGTDHIYTELTYNYDYHKWGCAAYDHDHGHRPYFLTVICMDNVDIIGSLYPIGGLVTSALGSSTGRCKNPTVDNY
jgi:hypothetical protein